MKPGGLDIGAEMSRLRLELEAEAAKEAEAEERIAAVLRANSELPRQLSLGLGRLRTRLALLESDAGSVKGALEAAAGLADSVSGKVRELDLAKGRVVDCLQRLEDLQDLKHSTAGVTAALAGEDYEAAAGHVQRFLALHASLFAGEGAKEEADLGESYRVLESARSELSRLVAGKFEEAVREGDVASVQRFLKLFPQIGEHREGIRRFGDYLAGCIAEVAAKNLVTVKAGGEEAGRSAVLFADGLTLLFEGIARVLEQNQPIVSASYGAEWSLALVKILQVECDRQADLIVSEFLARRKYSSQARLVETYARQSAKNPSTDRLNPLELDVLLSEVSLIQTRGDLYLRFLRKKIGSDLGTLPAAHPEKARLEAELTELIRDCGLSRRLQELMGHYISMELYYMTESVAKAMEMDAKEGLTSSMVEDVFFLVRKSLTRSLSTRSIDCVCAMLNNAATLLETKFAGEVRRQLAEGYAVSGSVAEAVLTVSASYNNVLQAGKLERPMSEGEKAREKFLLALNNAAASEACLRQLRSGLESDLKRELGEAEGALAKAEHSLGLLDGVGARLKETERGGVEALVTSVLKPRLRAALEAFLDANHAPNEEEMADFEVNDPWVQAFIAALDAGLQGLKESLVEAAYADLVSAAASEVARQLEKSLRKVRLNRLGGLQLEKEVREVVAYLGSVGGWVVRERLGRLSAIASLLNSESLAEARDFLASARAPLPIADARGFLSVRTDLPLEEIKRLHY